MLETITSFQLPGEVPLRVPHRVAICVPELNPERVISGPARSYDRNPTSPAAVKDGVDVRPVCRRSPMQIGERLNVSVAVGRGPSCAHSA